MKKIHFYFIERQPTIRHRKKLKAFIEELFSHENKRLSALSYIICSDEYLLEINRKFLKHDFYTDVITFDLSSSKTDIEGEIYLSVDRIKENAKTEAVSFQEELHRVIFHGALHLCGYKDKKSSEINLMRATEQKYLDLYFK